MQSRAVQILLQPYTNQSTTIRPNRIEQLAINTTDDEHFFRAQYLNDAWSSKYLLSCQSRHVKAKWIQSSIIAIESLK